MADPQVRIFPHSKEEFPSEESLKTWLLGDLRNKKGGVYHLRTVNRVKELPPGSIVLFRYGKVIVGEAVVWKGKKALEHGAQVTFAPASVRLYAPPLSVEQIRAGKNIASSARVYVKLDWSIYACVLKEVVSRGTFIS